MREFSSIILSLPVNIRIGLSLNPMAAIAIPLGWEVLAGVCAIAVAVLFAKTAQEIISEKKKGSINQEFPGE